MVKATEVTKKNISKLSHKDKVRFALFCVNQAVHLIKTPESQECIRVTELWLDGKATADDCETIADEAGIGTDYQRIRSTSCFAVVAARAAAYTAYSKEDASSYANHTSYYTLKAGVDCLQEIEEYLYELVHINDIIESVLLGDE